MNQLDAPVFVILPFVLLLSCFFFLFFFSCIHTRPQPKLRFSLTKNNIARSESDLVRRNGADWIETRNKIIQPL